jgi:hypothetical protein
VSGWAPFCELRLMTTCSPENDFAWLDGIDEGKVLCCRIWKST